MIDQAAVGEISEIRVFEPIESQLVMVQSQIFDAQKPNLYLFDGQMPYFPIKTSLPFEILIQLPKEGNENSDSCFVTES